MTNALSVFRSQMLDFRSNLCMTSNLLFRSLSSNFRSHTSLLILDSPGFQNPASCGREGGASFEDLCHNYLQERLQLLYHEETFAKQQDLYAQVCNIRGPVCSGV